METLTDREENGIKAIIFLQKMVNINETETTALRGWRDMSRHDQDFTLEFAKAMKESK